MLPRWRGEKPEVVWGFRGVLTPGIWPFLGGVLEKATPVNTRKKPSKNRTEFQNRVLWGLVKKLELTKIDKTLKVYKIVEID